MDGDKRSSEKIKSDKSSEKMIQVSDNISGFEVEVPGGHHDWVSESGISEETPLLSGSGSVKSPTPRPGSGGSGAGVGGILHARHDDAAALELLHRRQ